MKFKIVCLAMILTVFSGASLATNVDEWVYENTKGDLKVTAGCKDIDVAKKQASTGYRFKKYTTILCNNKGYGWGLEKVVDKGTVTCEKCDGDYEDEEKYRCYMKDVELQCRQVTR
ncbi:MAG: hypothetical protein KAG19_03310 [Methylococcales bacterium]|nr:hypothetical protein [Methylococcales bacterium]